ncbi:MAG: type II toxin-antitoxin system RelE/ParE family toxin [Candidatus Omnitrophica bacterium]|nr:type II toxin-antitoxin system RelE/ParE family toxin [Candidatus Omnitrophota bacterium]
MAFYKITQRRSVKDDFKRIDQQIIPEIVEKIDALAENSRPIGCKKLKDSQQSYRIRIGDYRVVYHIYDKEKEILIDYIRHRKDAYRKR